MLFMEGVDVNAKDHRGLSALHIAVRYQLEAILLLHIVVQCQPDGRFM
jgi:ankyrin repeat protein